MSLQDELTRVQEYLTDASKTPSNEANTCHGVISPLLRHCGYDFHEIDVQAHDSAGKIPDYTILPHTPFTWFLEAKAWQESLADAHVIQAMNYAHTQGHRWVVLSNGREWRLYDDHIVGVQPADRLVAVARLECTSEIERLLGALSKPSVQSGGVAAFGLSERIATVLNQQLYLPNSEVIKSITSAVKNKLGLATVTANDVVGYFNSRLRGRVRTDAKVPAVAPEPPKRYDQPQNARAPSDRSLSLPDLLSAGFGVQNRKPATMTFPDMTEKHVTSWRDVTLETVSWLFASNKRPKLPFRGRNSGEQYLISSEPTDGNPDKARQKSLTINGEVLYVHVNRNATDFISCLIVLCEEVGVPASGFLVRLENLAGRVVFAEVLEISEEHEGRAYRAVYTTRMPMVVYVLHVFEKKSTQGIKTPQKHTDIVNARLRLSEADYEQRYPDQKQDTTAPREEAERRVNRNSGKVDRKRK